MITLHASGHITSHPNQCHHLFIICLFYYMMNQDEDEDTNASNVDRQRHDRASSWTGSSLTLISEIFFGSGNATNSNSHDGEALLSNNELSAIPPKPPTVSATRRRRSLDEERQTYHVQNQQFLQMEHQAQQAQIIKIPPAPLSSRRKPPPSPNKVSNSMIIGMSPAASSNHKKSGHKRLPSIDEGGGGATAVDSEFMTQLMLPKQQQHTHHNRIQSDGEVSALSIGSFWSRMSDHDSNSTSSVWSSKSQQERMAKFEQEQEEPFIQTKELLEEKLSHALDDTGNDSGQHGKTISLTEKEKKEFIQDYMSKLERERELLLTQWKAEWEAERQYLHQEAQNNPSFLSSFRKLFLEPCLESIIALLSIAEVFVANLPLTIGAVGLSWVTMGTVWFKFMEEIGGFCTPVHYYSPTCAFPEFPGCFECDTSKPVYQWALYFHYGCSTFAGVCCVLFLLKLLVARKVVVDELSNPTTSTPMGVVCIATECVFAGRGFLGESIVVVTSWFHFVLAFWFLYMAVVRFGLWPDPGWFPNTVGLTYGAVKTFLYFPTIGLFFLAFALVLFFSIFFVSVVRVALNRKIAAPVAWIGLSAPSITMYALTLVAQPDRNHETLEEHDSLLLARHHDWLVRYYLPLQHFMMFLSLVGLASAVISLVMRWEAFSKKPFSPAHVAFCFPTLSHTNAVQAYRGAVNAFSNFAPGGPFKVALFSYWVFFLVVGTGLNLCFTFLYIQRLPAWTKIDIAGEDEPPAPEDTFVQEMLDTTGTHELLDQPFMNPAVLQANEAGALRRVRRGTEEFRLHGPYVRTRNVSALGFDPTMDEEELRRERAELLDWVAKNAPRKRNRTMSNPLFLQGGFGRTGNGNDRQAAEGPLYGTFGSGGRHKRSFTTTHLPGA
jgi:tellurite resistance protein TehA-like permease